MSKKINIQQRDFTDCGAACLASVCIWHGLHFPVSRIRQYAGTDKAGTNIAGLLQAAEKLGFEAKAGKGGIESLARIPLPAIAHTVLHKTAFHFVVVLKVTSKSVFVMDPAEGRTRKISMPDFSNEWTGVLVLLMPGDHFIRGNKNTPVWIRFWHLVRPHRSVLLQALIGAIAYTLLGLATSMYLQKIVDFVLTDGNTRLLHLLSFAMLFLLFVQLFIGTCKTWLVLRTGQQIDAQLIPGYYKHLLKLPQRFFDTMRVGEIISRINDAVKIRVFVNEVALQVIVDGLIIVFSIGLMCVYYWKLALIMAGIIPVYFLLYRLGNRVNRKYQRILMEKNAVLEAHLVESLHAAHTIKAFVLEDHALAKTETRLFPVLKNIYRGSIKVLFIAAVSELATHAFTIAVLWAGSLFVIRHELSPGELLSFYSLAGYFTSPAISLINATKNIQDAFVAADRLFEITDLEPETALPGAVCLTPGHCGDIVFAGVCFTHGSRTAVFDGLDVRIRKGTFSAIVGESGCGKSTLLSLLQSLYPVTGGSINIGDIDIRYIDPASLRRVITVVPQQIDLFAGTIAENIAPGDPDPDMALIIEVAKKLGIDEFIEKLPEGFYTTLGEQGLTLSGGQRQRIAIARALYRKPEILLLDEATAALDTVSEQKVQHVLREFVNAGKTVIMIAHRLSAVRQCDNIFVLKGGKLAEQGNHQELVRLKGEYYRLWQYNGLHGN